MELLKLIMFEKEGLGHKFDKSRLGWTFGLKKQNASPEKMFDGHAHQLLPWLVIQVAQAPAGIGWKRIDALRAREQGARSQDMLRREVAH